MRARPLSRPGLPRCAHGLSHVLFPLPRWTREVRLSVGFPRDRSLPRHPGGSASTTVLSRPAQDSLRVTARGIADLPLGDVVPAASTGGLPHSTVQVATELNRLVLGRIFHPLVVCTFVAHWMIPCSCAASRASAICLAMRSASSTGMHRWINASRCLSSTSRISGLMVTSRFPRAADLAFRFFVATVSTFQGLSPRGPGCTASVSAASVITSVPRWAPPRQTA